jgi:hypothetical protein
VNKLKQLGQITVLTQVINLLPFAIVTFIFDKAIYGEFASTMSVAGVLGISSALKLDIYNLDKKQGFHYFDVISYLFPLWLCYLVVLWYYNLSLVLGLSIAVSIGIYDFTSNSLLQDNRIVMFNRLRLMRVCMGILGYLFLWFQGVTVEGLLIVELGSRLIPTIICGMPRLPSSRRFGLLDLWECIRITVGWSVNNSVVLLIPFIIGKSVDLTEVGWYFLFYKGLNQIEVLFASTVNQYIVSLSKGEILNGYLRKLLAYTGMYVMAILVASFTLITMLTSIFGYYSNLFLFATGIILFSGLGSPFYIILNIIGKSKFQFKWDLTRFSFFVMLVLVARSLGVQYFLIGLPLLLLFTYSWMHFKIFSVGQISSGRD